MHDHVVAAYDPKLGNDAAVQYALTALLRAAGIRHRVISLTGLDDCDAGQVLISYGPDKPVCPGARHVHMHAAPFFQQENYRRATSLPGPPTVHEGVPVLYATEQRNDGRDLTAHQDLVASTFFLLTRYEEVVQAGPLDRFGRFPASSSVLKEHDLLHRPLVNEYAELLRAWVRQAAPDFAFVERSYHGHDFAVALTHDVDSLRQYSGRPWRHVLGSAARGRLISAYQALRSVTGRLPDAHQNLTDMVEWEAALGIGSSFYFMANRGPNDANYLTRELDEALPSQLRMDGSWEIGFHAGYDTCADEGAFRSQLSALKEELAGLRGGAAEIRGGRQHYLRLSVPETWRLWERAGLLYDTTLGFADHEGFRAGICLPYQPFDLAEGRPMGIWELPLTVMDSTLAKYRRLSPEQCRHTLDQLLCEVQRHRGVLVLLWHNTYFGRRNAGAYHDVFAGFVQDALERGAYVGPGREIVECLRTV